MSRIVTEHKVRRLVVELLHILPCNVRFKTTGFHIGVQILLPGRKYWQFVASARSLPELYDKLEMHAILGYYDNTVEPGF